MEKVIRAYKPVGMTPLQLINKIRNENSYYKDIKMGYAGRLDPMAEGEMIILLGEECKNRKKYERLDKEYEFDVLFGVSTDTYDILGKITNTNVILNSFQDLKLKLKKIIPTFLGKQIQEYPPYSSPRVKGKPLFWWAREGRLNEIEIPKKEIEVYDLKLISAEKISSEKLQNCIFKKINRVEGKFRQKEIIKLWQEYFDKYAHVDFPVFKLKMRCSSGTYVRSISQHIAQKINFPTITLTILRTKINLSS